MVLAVSAGLVGQPSRAGAGPGTNEVWPRDPSGAPVLHRSVVGPLASDGRPLAPMGSLIMVPCGNPLVPLGQQYRLPATCVPQGLEGLPPSVAVGGAMLVGDARESLVSMFAEARGLGLAPLVVSAYRSYAEQEATFAYWVGLLGEEQARRLSARAGHSEHQLGTTIDVSTASLGFGVHIAFGSTPDGEWLERNGARFGWVLSYPPDMEAITGYRYEPWHFRYVGTEIAAEITASGLTAIEYFAARFRRP